MIKLIFVLIQNVLSICNSIGSKTDSVIAKLNLNLDQKISTRQADIGLTTAHRDRIDTAISTRQANWGATSTHSARIDTNISTRADQATVNAINAKIDSNANYFLPSSNILYEDTTERLTTGQTQITLTEFKCTFDGYITLTLDYKNTPGGSPGYNVISISHKSFNPDNALSTVNIALPEDAVYRTASYNFTVIKGETFLITGKNYVYYSSQYPAYVKNVRIKGSPATVYAVQV